MDWNEAVARYMAAYEFLADMPMTPIRQTFAQTLLRKRTAEEIDRATVAILDASGTDGKYAIGLMTKFENGSWEPPVAESLGQGRTPTAAPPVPSASPVARTGPAQITNAIGMTLKLISAGDFLMGSPDSDDMAKDPEKPQHRVRITRPFYLGICPVTQSEYERMMGANPSRFQGHPQRPVEQVTSEEAQEFCRKLSALPAESAVGRTYRLPTEAQWESACRAGSTTVWYFGDRPSLLDQYAWFRDNAGDMTYPVGQKKPNAWGLFDMHGNVFELCEDSFDARYYADSPVDDPAGPPLGDSLRAMRGGCWAYKNWCSRSAHREFHSRRSRSPMVGFRVALGAAE